MITLTINRSALVGAGTRAPSVRTVQLAMLTEDQRQHLRMIGPSEAAEELKR